MRIASQTSKLLLLCVGGASAATVPPDTTPRGIAIVSVGLPLAILVLAFLLKLFLDRRPNPADYAQAFLALPVDVAFLAISLVAGFCISRPDDIESRDTQPLDAHRNPDTPHWYSPRTTDTTGGLVVLSVLRGAQEATASRMSHHSQASLARPNS